MKVIILAAGIGSRLGTPFPKPLTMLKNGCSILQLQIRNITRYLSINNIILVVGFKKELIMEAAPEVMFVYNDFFDTTNTAKSLLKGLSKIHNEDVLWMNGDVVFDHTIIKRLLAHKGSCMAVNTEKVADEEIKYTLSHDGSMLEVSKQVKGGLGEAIGINLIRASDLDLFKECLMHCSIGDYFERGIEIAIAKGLKVYPIDISDLMSVEVDFPEDLERANSFFNKK